MVEITGTCNNYNSFFCWPYLGYATEMEYSLISR